MALKRNNFDQAEIEALSEAYRLLYRAKVGLDNAREILNGKGDGVDIPPGEAGLKYMKRHGIEWASHYDAEQEGEKAKEEVLLALEITAQKMQVAQRGIERLRTGNR